MMSEWLLEWIWIIFVQGPLLIIRGIDEVFSQLMGFGIGNKFFDVQEGEKTILIVYSTLLLLSIIISVYAIFIKFIKTRADDHQLKQTVLTTIKYTGINVVILVFIPITIVLMSMLLDFITKSILDATINDSGLKSIEIARQLYTIGYIGPSPELIKIPDNLGPNYIDININVSYLKNYNYVVQIICTIVSMIMPLYLCWTFLQKYIEIFVFVSIMPLSVTSNFIDDGARFKVMIKEVFGKFVMILWCFLAFWIYKTLYSVLFMYKGNERNFETRAIIYTISIIAINFCLFLFTKLIGRSFNEKTGIIGTYKSSKQTYIVSKSFFNSELLNRSSNEYKSSLKTIEDYEKENKKSIDSLKSSIEINNKSRTNFNQLKDINLFNEKMN